MNSLNILSARVSPPPSRSNSYGSALSLAGGSPTTKSSPVKDAAEEKDEEDEEDEMIGDDLAEMNRRRHSDVDEKTPILEDRKPDILPSRSRGWFFIPKSIATAFIISVRWVVSAIMAPGIYIISCLYDKDGNLAPLFHLKKVGNWLWKGKGDVDPFAEEVLRRGRRPPLLEKRKLSPSRRPSTKSKNDIDSTSSPSGLSSESESERDRSHSEAERRPASSNTRHTRSKSLKPTEEISPARRSIRIKLHNEGSEQHRKHRKSQSANTPFSQSDGSGGVNPSLTEITPATLKSPTSPAATLSMTRYPRAPAPPRPLIPRRLPSYTLAEPMNGRHAQKTLILDLDETLIHSMAKGGRMSTGHMVEVKLNTFVSASGVPIPGPQHPILYYVHKRPHCDDFLRRVCKWYNLVIFTASVQEYADPVIDWLEQERKFFSGRLYRQHCTFRHGAFIKDLSSVEPDLSRVMILDNSPLSYMFHQGMLPIALS